jgi:hypothetical protein
MLRDGGGVYWTNPYELVRGLNVRRQNVVMTPNGRSRRLPAIVADEKVALEADTAPGR